MCVCVLVMLTSQPTHARITREDIRRAHLAFREKGASPVTEKMGADEKLAAAALATKKEEVADQGRAQASAGGTKHEAKTDAL